MALTPIQIQQLKNAPANKIVSYIDSGHINYPVDLDCIPGFDPKKRTEIDLLMAARPNKQEQAEWAEIMPILSQLDNGSLRQQLLSYVAHWSTLKPSGNHLVEAGMKLKEIESYEAQLTAKEEAESWAAVDRQNPDSLKMHLAIYPSSTHKGEIEECLWTIAKSSSNPVWAVREFLALFPESIHSEAALALQQTYSEWQEVESGGDLQAVYEYIEQHPGSPLTEQARTRIQELKRDEIDNMRQLQSAYPISSLFYYIEKGIFTEDELINEGVATIESLDILHHLDEVKDSLPDINVEISKCNKELAKDHTDVFLFGIPSTGKTCILMGLIGSQTININTVRSGGPYACALQQYLEAGFTIGQTPKDFVATIEAEIPDGNKKHQLNLIEMAGEDFAFKIADNENGKVSFEDIGVGATEVLCNNNRKVFFIIVDPTARTVAFNHVYEEQEADGTKHSYLIRKNVNQGIILKRMVDLLCLPENSHILDKVDFIHIIVTKADVYGDGADREEKAMERFMQHHRNIVQPLTDLCQKHGINVATKGVPKLYTFSLGSFYVGGIYKYNHVDADKLVGVLKENTESVKPSGFWGGLKKLFN